MALITSLPATTTLTGSNVFVIDTGSQTQKITASNAGSELFRLGAPMTVSKNTILTGESITLTFEQYTMAVMFLNGYTSNTKNAIIVSSSPTQILMNELGASSQLAITTSGTVMTITNNSAYSAYADLLIFRGSVTAS